MYAIRKSISEGLVLSSESADRVKGTVVEQEVDEPITRESDVSRYHVERELDELGGFEELAKELDGLVIAAEGVSHADCAHLSYVELGLTIALSGHPTVSPESLTPNLLRETNATISTEGIREFIDNIWKAIVNGLKSVWKWLQDFWYNMFGEVTVLRRKIKSLRKQAIKSQTRSAEESTVTLNARDVGVLRTGRKNLKDMNLTGDLEQLSDIMGSAVSLRKESLELKDGLVTMLGEASSESLYGALTAYTKQYLDSLPGTTGLPSYLEARVSPDREAITLYGTEKEGWAISAVHTFNGQIWGVAKCDIVEPSENGLGSIREELALAPDKMDVGWIITQSRTVRKSGWFCMEAPKPIESEESDVSRLAPDTIIELCDTMAGLLDTIETQIRGKVVDTATKYANEIQRAGDSLQKAKEQIDSDSSVSTRLVQEACNYVTAYTNWNTRPISSLMSTATSAITSTINYSQLSLRGMK